MAFDLAAFQAIHGFAHRSSVLDLVGIFAASVLGVLIAVAFLLFAFRQPTWRQRLYVLFAGTLSVVIARGVLGEIIRAVFNRPRPPIVLPIDPLIGVPGSSGFPSGHAMALFALAAFVFILRRKWGFWFGVGALVVGLARVFVGVHWPADIIAGAFVGIAGTLIAVKLLPPQLATDREINAASLEGKPLA